MLNNVLELKKDLTRKYLEYQIAGIDNIDKFSEGMLKNNVLKGIVPISFQQIDDGKFYSFDITHMISLKDYFINPIKKNDLINIFISIINTYSVLDEYMIENKYLLLDFEYIYINQESKDLKCICLPLNNIESDKTIYNFIKETIMSVKYGDEDIYITKLLNYINSSSDSSLIELKNYLTTLSNEDVPMKRQSEKIDVDNNKVENKINQVKAKQPIPVIKSVEKVTTSSTEIPKRPIPSAIKSPVEQKDKPIVSKKTKSSKIPTLRNRNNQDMVSETKEQEEPKEKKKLFGRSTKEKKSSLKIPSLKNTESKIPKMSKRISGEEAKKSLSSGIQREIQQTYQEDLTKVQAEGTTVLGVGTTVLGTGTTILGNQEKQTFAKLTRVSNQYGVVVNMENFRIGKDQSNPFAIMDNSAVSRSHAEIITKEGRYYLTDLNSTNKTYVDGVQVKPGSFVEIFDGSRIKIANEDLIFNVLEVE